jgi:aconitate hydratase
LVAPETAAASALTGVITDPRDLNLPAFSYEMPEKFINDTDLFIHPAPEPDNIAIRRGPNIKPLPEMPHLPDITRGEVIIYVGDNVTTDHICPAGALYLPIRSNIPEISKHAFKVLDDKFAERASQKGGGFIVGGTNYAQGSSREQAAIVPRYLGIKAVITKGFARLHLANMVNWGLLPLLFENSEDYHKFSQGDILSLDTTNLVEGKRFILKNETKNVEIPLITPLCQADLDAVKAGGRINWVRNKNKREKGK